jgi:amidase
VKVSEYADLPFTAAFSISGHPAISLPFAGAAEHVPVGVQVVAGTAARTCCSVSLRSSAGPAGADRRPPVCAG